MACLMNIPVEILSMVATELRCESASLAALAATCRSCHELANPILYRGQMVGLEDFDGNSVNAPWVVNWAAETGSLDTIKRAVEYGASATTHQSNTRIGDTETRWYCMHQVSDRRNRHCGYNPLQVASRYGHNAVVTWLLDHGAPVDGRNADQNPFGDESDDSFMTPLGLAFRHPHISTIQLLVSRGASVYHPLEKGWTTVHEAAQEDIPSMFEFLVQSGLDLDAQTCYGNTALTQAIRLRHYSSVDELIRLGANLEIGRSSPLKMALQIRNYDAALCLVEAGVCFDVDDMVNALWSGFLGHNGYNGPPYDYWPEYFGDWRPVASKLIEMGWDVNAESENVNPTRRTLMRTVDPVALMEHIELLVFGGADVQAKNDKFETVLDVTLDTLLSGKALPAFELHQICRGNKVKRHPVNGFEALDVLLRAGASIDGRRGTFVDLFTFELQKSASCGGYPPADGVHRSALLTSIKAIPLPRPEPWVWLGEAIEQYLESTIAARALDSCLCLHRHFLDTIVELSTQPLRRRRLDKLLQLFVKSGNRDGCKVLSRAGATLYMDRAWLHQHPVLGDFFNRTEIEWIMFSDTGVLAVDNRTTMAICKTIHDRAVVCANLGSTCREEVSEDEGGHDCEEDRHDYDEDDYNEDGPDCDEDGPDCDEDGPDCDE